MWSWCGQRKQEDIDELIMGFWYPTSLKTVAPFFWPYSRDQKPPIGWCRVRYRFWWSTIPTCSLSRSRWRSLNPSHWVTTMRWTTEGLVLQRVEAARKEHLLVLSWPWIIRCEWSTSHGGGSESLEVLISVDSGLKFEVAFLKEGRGWGWLVPARQVFLSTGVGMLYSPCLGLVWGFRSAMARPSWKAKEQISQAGICY